MFRHRTPSIPVSHQYDFPARAKMQAVDLIFSSAISYGTIATTLVPFGYVIGPTPVNNGDSYTTSFVLRAGVYTFQVVGVKQSAAPKIDWYVDDVAFVTGQDWYAASSIGATFTTTGVIVTGNGVHRLKGVSNGKNASSSNYAPQLTVMSFFPAVD